MMARLALSLKLTAAFAYGSCPFERLDELGFGRLGHLEERRARRGDEVALGRREQDHDELRNRLRVSKLAYHLDRR
jgi:hypothetical protein